MHSMGWNTFEIVAASLRKTKINNDNLKKNLKFRQVDNNIRFEWI